MNDNLVDLVRYALYYKARVERFRSDLEDCRKQIQSYMIADLHRDMGIRSVVTLMRRTNCIFLLDDQAASVRRALPLT